MHLGRRWIVAGAAVAAAGAAIAVPAQASAASWDPIVWCSSWDDGHTVYGSCSTSSGFMPTWKLTASCEWRDWRGQWQHTSPVTVYSNSNGGVASIPCGWMEPYSYMASRV